MSVLVCWLQSLDILNALDLQEPPAQEDSLTTSCTHLVLNIGAVAPQTLLGAE